MSSISLRMSLESKYNRKLSKKLFALRKENNLTQRGLAQKLSVSQSYVSKVELGQRRLDIIEVNKYVKALNYSIEDLIKDLDM